MFLDLQKVPPEGQAVDRSIGSESLDFTGEDFRIVANVVLEGRLSPVEEEGVFRFRGSLATKVETGCVRCLEPVLLPVAEELDLLYLPQSRNVAPVIDEEEDLRDFDRGLSPEELAVAFYQDERIDLSQMVLEQVVLALPMKTLCSAACRGLCPECGANRNVTECACAAEQTDPRWETLKSLLGR